MARWAHSEIATLEMSLKMRLRNRFLTPPEASFYRGKDALRVDGTARLPCEPFHRGLTPGQPLLPASSPTG